MSPGYIRSGVRRLFDLAIRRPREAGADADAELQSVLDEQIHHLMARGMPAAEARAEALRRLGLPLAAASHLVRHTAIHRERRMQLREWLDDLGHDLGYAVRTLVRSPGLAIAAILTLALAIGANTAIFSAVSAVMLRPLPFAEPNRLVALWEENPDFHWDRADAAPANMYDWREQAGVFSDVAAYQSFNGPVTLTGYGEPRLLNSQFVTGSFFTVLGVRPVAGRVFREEETWDDTPRAVVLSNRVWRDVFAGDPALVAKTVTLAGQPVEVVGVLPASFSFPGLDVDIWQTMRWDKASRSQTFFRRAHWLRPVARLKPGVEFGAANAALQTVVTRLKREYPQTNVHMGAGMTPLHEFLVGSTRLPLLVMFGAVALLLLIACGNIANLLLVRAAGRAREGAVRLALGAGRGRLVRQALAESGLLALAGGGAGLLLGWWGTRVLAALQPAGMLPVKEFALSWSVLGYAALVTLLSATLFGLAPTLWTARRVPADVLRDEGRTTSGTVRARRFGEALLVGQVALALALTLGAGLLVRSYVRLQRVDPGFEPRGVLAVGVNLPGLRYDSTRKVLAFFDELERGVRALPGVTATSMTARVPLGPSSWTSEFAVQGRAPMTRGNEVAHAEITPGYQSVLRVPLIKGRLLTGADGADAPNVVLINQAMAETYFRGEDPVGKRIAFDREPDSTSTWRTIVGVVGSEHQTSLAVAPKPEVIAPFPQELRRGMTLLLRTTGAPVDLAPGVRAVIRRLDPLLAVGSIRTMEEVRALSFGRDRFLTTLMLGFAGVGLALGLVGIYGVMAQLARRRMREMGIRIALGARAGQVQWLVVRHGMMLTGLGIGLGVAAALATTGIIRTLLYDVAPADPVTFVSVPLLVLVTAVLASWLPAARASRADPTSVLRAD